MVGVLSLTETVHERAKVSAGLLKIAIKYLRSGEIDLDELERYVLTVSNNADKYFGGYISSKYPPDLANSLPSGKTS